MIHLFDNCLTYMRNTTSKLKYYNIIDSSKNNCSISKYEYKNLEVEMVDLFDNYLIGMIGMTPTSEILQYYRFKRKHYSTSKI